MGRFSSCLRSLVGLPASPLRADMLPAAVFTAELAAELKAALPKTTVTIVKDLQVTVETAEGGVMNCRLENAYAAYADDPAIKAEVMREFSQACSGMIATGGAAADVTRIVPLIKDRPFLEEARAEAARSGENSDAGLVWEGYNPELVILYGQDSANRIDYLRSEQLAELKLKRADLRALACRNLERLLPALEVVGKHGIYRLGAGGDYEASLLLLDSVWSRPELVVKGELVIAIPTRDVLLVTGSEDARGLAQVRRMVDQEWEQQDYRLTRAVFVRRTGKFELFMGTGEPGVEEREDGD